MAERWAKLHARISESYDFAALHEMNPHAAMLFLLALPQADVFGVLPGHPQILKGRLCPLLSISPEDIDKALDAMAQGGLVARYLDDAGKPWVHIRGYSRYQDVRWRRVAAPDHAMPPDWSPPQDMLDACKQDQSCPIAVWLRERSGTSPGPVPAKSRLDTDTDTDTDTPVGSLEEVPIAEESPVVPTAPQETHTPSDLPHDLHMRKSNHLGLNHWVREALKGRSQATQSDRWFAVLQQFTSDYPDLITETAMIEKLQTDPPLAADIYPDRYVFRLFPEVQARASPQPLRRRAQRASSPDEFPEPGRVK